MFFNEGDEMRRLNINIIAIVVLLLQGCAAVAVGAYAFDKGGKRDSRQKYFEEFNKTNIEREKNGLKPLELCAYKKSVDKEWAEEDANCK